LRKEGEKRREIGREREYSGLVSSRVKMYSSVSSKHTTGSLGSDAASNTDCGTDEHDIRSSGGGRGYPCGLIRER
jgi:hypothetical protein